MEVNSPLTNKTGTKLIREIQVIHLVNEWKNAFSIDISAEMKGNKTIYEYQCNTTGLYFFMPGDIDGSAKFYEALQHFDWYYMPEKWEHLITLKKLKPASKILEVGCAEGAFIELCTKHGHDATGIELNHNAVLKAKQKGLSVFEKDLHELASEKEKSYDCVCSFQVLEHISKPKEFIESCIKLLKPGGKLIFCVPNSDGLLATDHNLLDMPPHHMTRWNKHSFRSLESLFAVKLNCVHFEPLAKYHWDWYFNLLKKKMNYSESIKKYLPLNGVIKIYKLLFSFGFNKFIKGHTIFVEFIKK
jgi:2-polyprenyl-3-methyl-5-hydroxy-6-metoxy-1,4-benzoquinol methylase